MCVRLFKDIREMGGKYLRSKLSPVGNTEKFSSLQIAGYIYSDDTNRFCWVESPLLYFLPSKICSCCLFSQTSIFMYLWLFRKSCMLISVSCHQKGNVSACSLHICTWMSLPGFCGSPIKGARHQPSSSAVVIRPRCPQFQRHMSNFSGPTEVPIDLRGKTQSPPPCTDSLLTRLSLRHSSFKLIDILCISQGLPEKHNPQEVYIKRFTARN